MKQRLTTSISNSADSFATLLKQWRNQRGFSQLDLALASEVSQRHISFLESGRAKPPREMVLQLATVLQVPLRQQNTILPCKNCGLNVCFQQPKPLSITGNS